MGKVIKTILIIFFSVLLVIFLVLLTAPLLFKNQLIDLAKTELNKMLTAKVDFEDLTLSFIRSFPDAYIGLDGLEVTGIGDFEGEVLVAFDRFSVTVNLMSVIKMENIEVKSILLDRARLNGIILEDGRANWDIMKPGETKEETEEEIKEEIVETAAVDEEKEEASPFVFKVGLNRFEIRNLQASFRDDANNMAANFQSLNFNLRGDMRRENVGLKLELKIDGINFWLDGIRLANMVTVGFVSEVAADLKNMDFVIKDNRFNLNDIVLKFDGAVGMYGDDINVDVTFGSERTDFKSLMSLVPAVYMNDFKDLRTTGSLALGGDVKGTYNQNMMPSANVNLSVDNATFSYPDLPKSVERINIAIKAHYDGEVFDRTTLDVDRFSFEIAGNPFSVEVHAKTPESDLEVSAKFAGKIDFNSLADIVPMDNLTLNGLLECDISLAGKLSTIEKEQYEDFQAAGSLKLNGFYFQNPDFPQGARISNLVLNFTPRYVELANLEAVTGGTDVALNGSLENFIPFVLRNDTVRGNLALRSNKIDLNEFMGGEPAEETPEETGPMSVIEVPKNIDFTMTINIGNILFDKLAITNTVGALLVRDGKVVMQNLGMNLLDGSMTLNGEYNTQNITAPLINFDMNIRQFDISSALSSFSMLANILPEPQNYVGKVSAALMLYSILDNQMSPVLDSVASKGQLQTQNLEIRNSKMFGTMADLINNERWRTPALGNVNIGFEIKDGRLWIEEPIVMNMQSARMEIKGDQGLDMSLNYRLDAFVPVSSVGSSASNILSNIPGGLRINEIQLTGHIRGTAKNPDVSLSMADMASAVTGAMRDQVTQRVSDEVNRQIDQIMREAERQAENIRNTAKIAADRVRNEANNGADRLVNNAGTNPVQRRLAQESAATMRREGETNARRIEQEADTQARAVLNSAQRRADELRRN